MSENAVAKGAPIFAHPCTVANGRQSNYRRLPWLLKIWNENGEPKRGRFNNILKKEHLIEMGTQKLVNIFNDEEKLQNTLYHWLNWKRQGFPEKYLHKAQNDEMTKDEFIQKYTLRNI